MSICGTPLIHRPIPAQESIFCAELAQLPLPERARRIDLKLRETRKFLGARNEKLLALRGDFDALTLDFWRRFARGLGCEEPERTIAAQKERMRSIGHISIILLTIAMTGLAAARAGAIPELVVFIGVAEVVTLCVIIGAPLRRISRAQDVIIILGREQEPFWLIGGSIALSNLSVTPPLGSQWIRREQLFSSSGTSNRDLPSISARKPQPNSCRRSTGSVAMAKHFICAATNRLDHACNPMLSRFAEQIEIPLQTNRRTAHCLGCFSAPCALWAIGTSLIRWRNPAPGAAAGTFATWLMRCPGRRQTDIESEGRRTSGKRGS
jgi:hypothetical protein